MKRFKIITGLTLIALVAGAVLMHSCSKQETQNPSHSDSQVKDYTVYNELSSFREKMDFYEENPTLKSDENVDVDMAIWLLEGAMNLTYGFPYKEYTDYEKGTATINLEKDNEGKINYNELAIKYQQVIDEAREDYYSSGFEEKGLYLVNLEITEETETEVTFTVETITGNLGEQNTSSPTFDHWWYGENEGGCEDNPAISSDAAQEFYATYPQIALTEEYTLVQPVQKTITGGEEWLRRPGDELDNEYDYYIYRVSEDILGFDYDEHCCLVSEEMDQYYQDLDYVLQDLVFAQPDIPTTHEFIRFTYAQGEHPFGSDIYFHRFECTFALKCDRPINDPAISL